MAKISCYPENPLVDEVIYIRIQGLSAGAPYTIRSSMFENKTNFSACGCYTADDNGVIDVNKNVCSEGTYSGIEPMGLFWSMKQEPGYKKHIRIIKQDTTQPLRVTLSIYEGHHTWETVCKNELQPILSSYINRWYKSKSVKRITVESGRLRGRLFVPPGQGPFPGIIDMFGGPGGLMEFRAALLASRGFVTYALPYFYFEYLPNAPALDLGYFLEAVEYLLSQDLVKRDKIGIIGVSKGAEIAMLTTMYSPKIAAAVFINGPPFLTTFDMKIGDRLYECVDKTLGFDFSKLRGTDECAISRDVYHYYTSNDIIQLWKTEAKLLYIVGEDDQLMNPNLAKALFNEYPKEKLSSIELKSYPGAGHLIEPPFMPLCRKSYNPQFSGTQLWGGQLPDHARAQEDAWNKIQQFFRKHLDLIESNIKDVKSRL